MEGDFDPMAYHRLFDPSSPDTTITYSNQALRMMKANVSGSSENWQIYWQEGRYFIRNYDYGASFQLGLTQDSRSDPKLLKRDGSLGQQWMFSRISDGNGFMITNGLLGNESYLALKGDILLPAMQLSSEGAVWDITINRSAGNVSADMTFPVADLEVATNTSTSSSIPSATESSNNRAPSSPSPPLNLVSIIAISISGLAVVIISVTLGWFSLTRKRNRRLKKLAYAHQMEMEHTQARDEAQDAGFVVHKFELDGAGVSESRNCRHEM